MAGIVLGGFLLTALHTRRVTEWLVMTDEMQYVKLALAMARDGALAPEIHGVYYPSLNQLYPALLAPLVGALDMPDAFRAAHYLNALVMASAAIPAYLLTLDVTRRRPAALVASALTVTVPWMAMAMGLVTEVAAYPAFLWAILGMQRAISEPSPRRDLLAAAGLLLAVLARTQYVLLVMAYPLLVAGHEAGYALSRRGARSRRDALRAAARESLRRHVVLWGAIAVAALVLVPLALVGDVRVLLGQYAGAAQGNLLPDGVLRNAGQHLDLIVVGLGVIPGVLGLGWTLGTLVRPSEKHMHAYAVIAAVVGGGLLLQVASFSFRFVGGVVQTRYLVPLAPLLIVATIAACSDRRRRWIGVLVAAAGMASIIGLYAYVPTAGPWFASPDTALHKPLYFRLLQTFDALGLPQPTVAGFLQWTIPVLGVGLALALRSLSHRLLLGIVGAVVLAYGIGATSYVLDTIASGPNGARPVSGTPLEGRDWVDRALPGERVALMPTPLGDAPVSLPAASYFSQTLWWNTEFWNKAADQVYAVPGVESYSAWPKPLMRVDESSGRLLVDDQRRYVVVAKSDLRWRLRGGRVLAATPELELLDVPRPYALEWSTNGLRADGTPAPMSRVRVYGSPSTAGSRQLVMGIVPVPELTEPRPYRLASERGRAADVLRPGDVKTAQVPVCVPARGATDVRLTFPGAPEPVGAHVLYISLRPAAGACP